EHRQWVAAHAGQRQDVGLHAGTAARVGGSEGQHDRREVGCRIGGGRHGTRVAWRRRTAEGKRNGENRGGAAGNVSRSSPGPMNLIELDSTPYAPLYAPMKKYMCLICGHIYDEALGDPDTGVPPGTKWEDVPPNWTCPDCGARKEDYELMEF